ncbi:hypothetical protein LCGC14_1277220 [marine sediment metagenome]|uniref:Uncharacterized protein n=1 Tax=marine sediment metagenome TaxID=412755 RepID=A0A0F9LHI7_9ZZZZ
MRSRKEAHEFQAALDEDDADDFARVQTPNDGLS